MSDQPPGAVPPPPGGGFPPPSTPPPAGGGFPPPAPPPPPGGGFPPPPPPGGGGGFSPPPPGAPGPGGPAPAGSNGVSIGDAFNWGWTKFQQNLGPILIATAIIFVVAVVFEIVISAVLVGGMSASTTCTTDPATGFSNCTVNSGAGFFVTFLFGYGIAALAFIFFTFIIQLAVIRATLAISYGQPVDLKMMFATDQLGPFIGAALLVSVAYYIGLIFCIIPGLAVLFFTMFFGWFIVDKKLGAVEAIKASVSLVNKNMGTLIGFYIATVVAYIVGAILCGIGLLVAVPVVILATGYMYRRLQGEAVAA